jgi:hypothetical protein
MDEARLEASVLEGVLDDTAVTAAAFDGAELVAQSLDGSLIRFWDPSLRKELCSVGPVYYHRGDVAFAPDGRTFAPGELLDTEGLGPKERHTASIA